MTRQRTRAKRIHGLTHPRRGHGNYGGETDDLGPSKPLQQIVDETLKAAEEKPKGPKGKKE